MAKSKDEEVLVTREQWLATAPRRYTVLTIANLGKVRIRSLTARERNAFERSIQDDSGEYDPVKAAVARETLITMCVVDANGETTLTLADVAALGEKDGGIIGDTFEGCRIHCGMEKKDFEKLKGN